MEPISKKKFYMATGNLPVRDDLERVNCSKAGEPMHHQCGWCNEHNYPRFLCGCLLFNKPLENSKQ